MGGGGGGADVRNVLWNLASYVSAFINSYSRAVVVL